jgi:hypothetical protein
MGGASCVPACWGCSPWSRTLLLAAAGDDGGVHVHGETVYAQAIEKPSIDLLLHLFVLGHVKAAEETHDGFVSCHLSPTEQAREGRIQTCNFGMRKAVCPAPDADQKLLNALHRFVASIGTRLRQIPLLGGIGKLDALEHSLHQCHAAPSRDLAVSKTDFKIAL